MKKTIHSLLFIMACLLPAFGSGAVPAKSVQDFEIRAFYVDHRTEVMTFEALMALADNISTKGYNAIVMEWEATFPFEKHATLCNQYAFTREQVKTFVAHCARLGIDVIPLQNCFGHTEYILRHDRYYGLRENRKEVSQVCPLKIEEATKVFTEIFQEVAALHPSKYFHIGADETYLLGSCKECSAVAAQKGKSMLFVDYVKAMSKIIIDMGKTPVIWADVIMHYPEAISDLPKELIFVDWNYGWKPGKINNVIASGVKMWGASALRSSPDDLYLTQWEKHFNNLSDFIPFARKSGYTGMIETSWSTSGTYGFHYNESYGVINMQPIRLVYPTSAFNILIGAFGEAVNSSIPFDPHRFVLDYAKTNYGLNAGDSEVLWDYFTMPQEQIILRGGAPKDSRGTALDEVLAASLSMREKLGKLTPKKNAEDFDHYRLMLDLRIHHLKFKQVEGVYESPEFDRSRAGELVEKLKALIAENDNLNHRFAKLNKGYLKNGELAYIAGMHGEKLKSMYATLTALR